MSGNSHRHGGIGLAGLAYYTTPQSIDWDAIAAAITPAQRRARVAGLWPMKDADA